MDDVGRIFLPDDFAQRRRAAPAGIRRHAATNSGVVCGAISFIATMDVPQKKKGLMSSSVSSMLTPSV